MSQKAIQIVPAIMCGGSGTRLWPASRESFPKQFLKLLGERSTFQTAVQRVTSSELFGKPLVIASHDIRFIVAEQLAEIGISAEIVLEPTRRDSAAAVAVAACCAARRGPETLVLVVAADHLIDDGAAFLASCREAGVGASEGYIMTLGVVPKHATTAYGYIKPGERIAGSQALRVDHFLEKPDAGTAANCIADGFLWNSGNLLFRADIMMEELTRFEPAILAASQAAVERSTVDLDFVRLDEAAFQRAPRKSIDYAVMESTERAGVLPVAFSWADIGTWNALWEASQRDPNGNALLGEVEVVGARNSLVHSNAVLTTLVGLDDVIVVAEPDAVLVASRASSEMVKELVGTLKAKNRPEADQHVRIYRPWGWYQRIDMGARFQVKHIMVKPGGRLSLQKHFHRAEHWIVVRGTAEVTVDEKITHVHENEAAYIPIGSMHRLANPGRIPLELIEVQVGSYTGEDDIVRVEDVYSRGDGD